MNKLIIPLMALLIATGCATRSYTSSEKGAMQFALAGQASDWGSTYYALEVDGGFEELNPVFGDGGNSDVLLGAALIKVGMFGVFYVAGEISPDSRKTLWQIFGWTGFAATGWNTYQIVTH